jgi:hypothetical protein
MFKTTFSHFFSSIHRNLDHASAPVSRHYYSHCALDATILALKHLLCLEDVHQPLEELRKGMEELEKGPGRGQGRWEVVMGTW